MGALTTEGRIPARQLIRSSRKLERETVRALDPRADNWPALFQLLGAQMKQDSNRLSPIALADHIEATMKGFADAIGEHGQFWNKRFGRRSLASEGVVLSHGHPMVDEDGVSMWHVSIVSGRSNTWFSASTRSNLSEHALGRWAERETNAADANIWDGLMCGAMLLHHIDWPSMSEECNDFNIPIGNVVLSGKIRAGSIRTRRGLLTSYMFDIRTALLPEHLSTEQKAQAAVIGALLTEPTVAPLMHLVDDRKEGPVRGCAVPPSRRDFVLEQLR